MRNKASIMSKKIIEIMIIVSIIFNVMLPHVSLNKVNKGSAWALEASEKANKEAKKRKLENEADELAKKKTAIDKRVNETKNKKDKKLYDKNNLDDQVAKKNKEIVELSQKISALNRDISKKEVEIEEKENDIERNKDNFKFKIKASYMIPKVTQLEAIMKREKYSELLSFTEYQAKISARDKEKIDKLTLVLKDINKEKKQIERDMSQIEMTKNKMEIAKKDLTQKVEKLNQEVYDIEKEEKQYRADAANLKKEMEALQAEIAKICKELTTSDTSPYVGGEFTWPVPGYYYISSPYGPRSFDGFHTGTDIAGPGIYGKNVVAANDGKVAFVNTGGRGPYGNYILVNHGGGYSTLYAHLSSFCCSYGQEVKKGQTIGLIGSTGFSTGPHLHFEVRINGKHTNPMSYFNKK